MAVLGEPGSAYRRDLEHQHQGDLSSLSDQLLEVYDLGSHRGPPGSLARTRCWSGMFGSTLGFGALVAGSAIPSSTYHEVSTSGHACELSGLLRAVEGVEVVVEAVAVIERHVDG